MRPAELFYFIQLSNVRMIKTSHIYASNIDLDLAVSQNNINNIWKSVKK